MRTNLDPPSDPYGSARVCQYCDQELKREWPVRGAEWICVNPDCSHSPRYVSFLKIPKNNPRFYYANDNDVVIRIHHTDHTYDHLIILRVSEGRNNYGWYLEGVTMEDDWQLPVSGPRFFHELGACVQNAIEYMRSLHVIEWEASLDDIENFMKLQ